MKRSVSLMAFCMLLLGGSHTALGDDEGRPRSGPSRLGAPSAMDSSLGLDASSPTGDVIPPVADTIGASGEGGGFAGQRTDHDNRSIEVWWKGVPPASVRSYAASRPFGVRIEIHEGAAYSRVDLDAARSRVWGSPLVSELGIVAMSLGHRGTGLRVALSRATPLTAAEMADLVRTAGIADVSVELGRRPFALYSRTNDAPPWKGGARIRLGSASGGACSSGFAVLTSGGYGRLLSARHCDTTANLAVYDGASQQIAPGGSSVSGIGSIDSLLIDPTASPATTYKVYTGGYGSNTTATVKNWSSNWPGDPVCASGASTGTHCGSVYDDSENIVVNGYTVNVIRASSASGTIMAGEGDSGGPVYKTITGGVQARGIVLGSPGPHTTSCGSVNPDVAPIVCSRYLDYVPISTILNTWGVSLEVG